MLVIPGIFPGNPSRDKSFPSRDSLFSKVMSRKKWNHGDVCDMWTGGKVKGGQLFESFHSSLNPWKQTVQPQPKGAVALPCFCSFRIKNTFLFAI